MTTPNSIEGDAPPPRKRGAPKGNRNAWTHGKRSAAAKAERQAARARTVAKLPDPRVLHPSLARADAAFAHFRAACGLPAQADENHNGILPPQIDGGGYPPPHFSSNKTNNSVAEELRDEGGTPSPHFPRNKTNNSVARKRGAPKGNRNALKHGSFTGQGQQFRAELRLFLRRVDATCRLANTLANTPRVQ